MSMWGADGMVAAQLTPTGITDPCVAWLRHDVPMWGTISDALRGRFGAAGLARSATRRRRGAPDGAHTASLEAEVIAFGEVLHEHPFVPGAAGADDAMRRDLRKALDAYDAATRALTGDDGRTDAPAVLRALDDGRHALACLDARLAGRPLPQRQLPMCFFDTRHGRATTQVTWTPAGGAPQTVAVCAADAVQLREGREPLMSRPARAALSKSRSGTGSGGAVPEIRSVGGGPRMHRLLMPPRRPALLVIGTERSTRVNVRVEDKAGRSSRFYLLGGGIDPVTARIPVPGKRKTCGFTVAFPDSTRERWTAGTASLDDVPGFVDGMQGDGSDVVHYRGAAGPGVLRHRGPGPVALEALDDHLAFWVTVTTGTGDTDLAFSWPGPGYFQMRATGAWTLERADEAAEPGPTA